MTWRRLPPRADVGGRFSEGVEGIRSGRGCYHGTPRRWSWERRPRTVAHPWIRAHPEALLRKARGEAAPAGPNRAPVRLSWSSPHFDTPQTCKPMHHVAGDGVEFRFRLFQCSLVRVQPSRAQERALHYQKPHQRTQRPASREPRPGCHLATSSPVAPPMRSADRGQLKLRAEHRRSGREVYRELVERSRRRVEHTLSMPYA